MHKLSDKVERKFIEQYNIEDYEILTDTGWEDISYSNKTIEYDVYEVIFDDGSNLLCADNHILIDTSYNEVFAKDSIGKTFIGIDNSELKVISVKNLGYSENMYDLTVDSENHTYFTNNVLSHNTTAVVGYLLHQAIFNSETSIAILANKAAAAKEVLTRITTALENLPYFLQPGCKALNKGNIDFSNNSTLLAASTSSSSIRGKSVKILYLDEFCFVHRAEEFWESTYPVITSGTTSRVIITSTLKGSAHLFYDKYMGAVQKTNDFIPFRVDWWDVPGRDAAWAEETRRNMGETRFRQEFGNEVISAGNSLISPDTLITLQAQEPIKILQNTHIYQLPEADTQYVMTVDVSKGRGQDYSTFTMFKIGENKFSQVATFRDNMISPLLFPDIIVKFATYYNEALVVVENNDAGQVVCNGIYYELEYENLYVESMVKAGGLGVTMTKKVKQIGCSNLKDIVEMRKLELVDKETIKELSNFVAKRNSYAADGNAHDDLVMNLVMFAYFTNTNIFTEMASVNIRQLLMSEREKFMEDDLPALGFIDSVNYDTPVSSNLNRGDSWLSQEPTHW